MLSTEEIKKYTKLDPCLKYINKNYISLNDRDREAYSKTLEEVLIIVRRKMADSDAMFRNCEGTTLYAGSSYDKVKVGKPDEFDLNIVIKLPAAWKNSDDIVVKNSSPSYVTINVKKGLERFCTDESFRVKFQKGISNWMDDNGFLIQDKFHSWMEGVVTRALNNFPSENGFRIVQVNSGKKYWLKHDKSGPAQTLRIHRVGEMQSFIDVDLVPVIEFNTSPKQNIWPASPVRQQPSVCRERAWCAVPKPKKNSTSTGNPEWRVSFYKQEKELMYDKGCMKNTIRQLKQLRSCHEETKNLPSYYIKTIFLWEMHDHPEIWSKYSNGALFMFMLKKLHEYLDKGRIPFYWDMRNNLLDAVGRAVDNMKHKLARIIKEIDVKMADDPNVIAHYMLNSQQLANFKRNYREENGVRLSNNFANLRIDGAGDDKPETIPEPKPNNMDEGQQTTGRCIMM